MTISRFVPIAVVTAIAHLSALQGQYEQAVRDGDADRATTLAEQIRSYQQEEGVRLRDVPDAYQVR